MIRREIEGNNGKTIVQLIPETEQDVQELKERAAADEVDDRHSFADDPGRLSDLDGETPEDLEVGAPYTDS